MQKKENVIVVANLFAFGIVCYSKNEDRILLIPKTENESGTDGSDRAGIPELLGTYFYTSSFCRRGKRLELAAILAAFVCFCLYISERNFLYTNLIGYLAFIAVSVTFGCMFARCLFRSVHDSLSEIRYREVDYIDGEIGLALKKKLRKDLLFGTTIPLLFLLNTIYLPFTLDTYLRALPVSVESTATLAAVSFLVYSIFLFSPPFLKVKAYIAVARLMKKRAHN